MTITFVLFICEETQKERTFTIDEAIYGEGEGGGAYIRNNISFSR